MRYSEETFFFLLDFEFFLLLELNNESSAGYLTVLVFTAGTAHS